MAAEKISSFKIIRALGEMGAIDELYFSWGGSRFKEGIKISQYEPLWNQGNEQTDFKDPEINMTQFTIYNVEEKNLDDFFDDAFKRLVNIRPSMTSLCEIQNDEHSTVESLRFKTLKCDDPDKIRIQFSYKQNRINLVWIYTIDANDHERRYQLYDQVLENIKTIHIGESVNGGPALVHPDEKLFKAYGRIGMIYRRCCKDLTWTISESDSSDEMDVSISFWANEAKELAQDIYPTGPRTHKDFEKKLTLNKTLPLTERFTTLFEETAQFIDDNFDRRWQPSFV